MRELRHRPRFRLERPRGRQAGQDLDGDVALETDVPRQVRRPHPSGPQAPRQPVLAGEELRNLRLAIRGPATALGRLAGLDDASAHGTLLGGRLGRRASRREHAQPPQGQARGRAQPLEEVNVGGTHEPVVEPAADGQHPPGPGTGTMASAAVSTTHAASSGGSSP